MVGSASSSSPTVSSAEIRISLGQYEDVRAQTRTWTTQVRRNGDSDKRASRLHTRLRNELLAHQGTSQKGVIAEFSS